MSNKNVGMDSRTEHGHQGTSNQFQERTLSLLNDFSKVKQAYRKLNHYDSSSLYMKNPLGHGLGLSAYNRPSSGWTSSTAAGASGNPQQHQALQSERKVYQGESSSSSSRDKMARPKSAVVSSRPVSMIRPKHLLQKQQPREEIEMNSSNNNNNAANHSGGAKVDKSLIGSLKVEESDEYKRLYQNISKIKQQNDTFKHVVVPSVEAKYDDHSSSSKVKKNTSNTDGIIFVETGFNGDGGVLVVYRTAEARSKNPDRLNLDHRDLKMVPLIENETKLRLLNFQHNSISHISNLNNMNKLVFLDLYNNQISKIANLDGLASLRVLMLGRNKIRTIENLDRLLKLDVLDLHANEISRVEGLSQLKSLRVLNLAANKLTKIELGRKQQGGLEALPELTELNLRKNCITAVSNLDQLPKLKHLYLSNNEISALADIECIFACETLTELALDGNSGLVASLGGSVGQYRQTIIERAVNLKCLDLVNVNELERRVTSARKEVRNLSDPEWVQAQQKMQQEEQKSRKERAMLNAMSRSNELVPDGIANPGGSSSNNNNKTNNSSQSSCALRKWFTVSDKLRDTQYMNKIELDFIKQRLSEHDTLSKDGYYEVQTKNGEEGKSLLICGSDFSCLENPKICNAINAIILQYTCLEDLLDTVFSKLGNLNHVHQLTMTHASIKTLYDLALFASNIPRNISSLNFKFSFITQLEFYRPWLVHHLRKSNVLMIDGVLITSAEREASKNLFGPIQIPKRSQRKLNMGSSKTMLKQKKLFIRSIEAITETSETLALEAIKKAQQEQEFQRQFQDIVHENITRYAEDKTRDAQHWIDMMNVLTTKP